MSDPAHSRFSLFRTRRFLPLFISQALGAFNDNIFRNALFILFTYRLAEQQGWDRGVLVALAGGVFILPFFLFSGIAGELADRHDKAVIARTVKLAEIAVALLAVLALWLEWVPLMLLVLFLAGTQSAFFGPVKYALLPQHLAERELVDANAFIETATFLAILLGTLTGGLLILTGHGLILVSLLMVALAVLGWLAALRIPPAPPASPLPERSSGPIAATWRVMREVAADRRLFGGVLAISWFWLLGSVLLAMVPPLARTWLGGNEQVANFFVALFTVGIGLGSWLAARLLKGEVSVRLAPVAALLMTVALFDLWHAVASLPPAGGELRGLATFLSTWEGARITIEFVLLATFGGLFVVPFYAWVQDLAPEAARARVIAANNIFNALFMAAGSFFLAAALAAGVTLPQVFLLLAVANLLVALYVVWRMPRQFLRTVGRGLFRLLYRVEIRGLEHVEEAGPRAVIVANHASYLDGPILATFLPEDTHFAVNTFTARGLLVRLASRIFDLLPIDPTNPMATRTLIKAVQKDRRVVIFPEGRISVTGSLMKIYEGPGVIAHKADAPVVPVRIEGAQKARFFSKLAPGKQRLRLFPKITVTVLPPVRLEPPEEMPAARLRRYMADRLYDVLTTAAFVTAPWRRHLMQGLLEARRDHGGWRKVVEDIQRNPVSFDRLLIGCHVLGHRLARMTEGEDVIGVLLPTSTGCLVTLLGLLTCGRTPAMLNFSTGAVNMGAACKAARVKTIVTSRRFIEQGNLQDFVDFLARQARIIWLEDVREEIGLFDKLRGMLLSHLGETGLRLAGARLDPEEAAVILFTSGSEGVPKGVVLSHANILANAHQVLAKIDLGATDVIFNALPMFHALGLSAGVFLPLLAGSRLFLYPSPLHYKIIPELVYDTGATVFFGTDTFLAGYARNAHPYDFYNVRYVVAGAERVRRETREVWMEKFGLRIYEGYGATETAPVLCVNTPMHFRSGTVGRFLPAIEYRIDPVEGIREGGRLVVRGPNVMKGYLRADEPGVIEPPSDGWYDTGDIVTVDAEGYVTIQGRAKRFAKIGGEMVSLTAVENVINAAFPQDANAVVSIRDRRKGERLVLITTRAGLDRKTLARAMKEQGAPELFIPRDIIVVESLPVLGSGKTDYVTLTAMAREKFQP
jgi:acyl-[acyl-carrier-protein]-phospholipid O-acyltransferase/long-chain-fatty-acid--[acyl-carrier-protein] ligase